MGTFEKLRSLLGKPVNDDAVAAVFSASEKVTIKSDFVIARSAGFDFALTRPTGAKPGAKKVLSTLFLFSEGQDGHQAFQDLPRGFSFSSREQLIATLGPPDLSWVIGKGKVPPASVASKEVSHDRWTIEGFECSANYRDGVMTYLTVSLSEDAMGGRDLSSAPLHFESKPADAPAHAASMGMALMVAWALTRFDLPKKHAQSEWGKKLLKRTVSPFSFLVAACEGTVTTLDVEKKLGNFLWGYTNRMLLESENTRRARAEKKIKALLGLRDETDRAFYSDDYVATFAGLFESPFYVPDSWDAVERMAPVLDARWADFESTAFKTAPDISLYEKAARARDAVVVVPNRVKLVAPQVDTQLAEDLISLIGKSLKDKAVQAVLARAGLPVGKRIDEQANPALGVAYMGSKFEISGLNQLGVSGVTFFASKQKSYIRGLGAEIEFVGFPGALPLGLSFGAPRKSILKKLGTPSRSDAEYDFYHTDAHRIMCTFAKAKLVQVWFGPLEG
jgi:hypothetical protein